jgi:hypothetical protein
LIDRTSALSIVARSRLGGQAGARRRERSTRREVVSLERSFAVQLSPRHAVTVDEDYLALIERAPRQDFVVRTLAKRMAGETPLMSGELVIAGQTTREHHPLAAAYPLHFRKTYYPGRLRGDPKVEFERHTEASRVLGIPEPIGYFDSTFRSCLLPGRPFDQVTPFGSDPEDSNIRHADKLPLASAGGLWLLAESIYATLTKLQEAGITHGDAELHNFVVCSAPLEVLPIDFDMAVRRDTLSESDWQQRCAQDLEQVLKVAVYLQCALGQQVGPLAELSLARVDTLFKRSDPFLRAIEGRRGLLSTL